MEDKVVTEASEKNLEVSPKMTKRSMLPRRTVNKNKEVELDLS